MAHNLSLFFPNNLDCRVLQIQDISVYDINTPVTNPVIKILIPGNDCPFYPIFKIKGTSYYTSNAFGVTNADCSLDLVSLEDGIYEITYSICPNDDVYYKTNIMRTCQSRNAILNQLSSIILEDCGDKVFDCFGKDITVQRIKELERYVRMLDMAELDTKQYKFSAASDKVKYVNEKLNITG